MRICTVNAHLAPALEQAGHEVLSLRPGPGLVSLPRLLERKGFAPDLVLQQETLSPRILLAGLDELPCPKVFWSVDTHLNLWWHGLYGQAFDLVLTTQDHLTDALAAMGAARTGHLPWFGSEAPFTPFAQRPRDMAFAGRVTPQRKARGWMLDFLSARFDLEHRQDVPYAEITEACARGRLAPNESIMGEVNFRLFEAASAGCAVLNQSVDADLSRLFEPGREVAVFRDVLELEALARRFLERPHEAEAMGRAARERVLREHLPAHRAGTLLRAVEGLPPRRRDRRSDAAWRLGVALAFQAGLVPLPPDAPTALLAARTDDPDVLAMLVRLTAESGDRARTAAMLKPLTTGAGPSSPELDMAASMAALRIGWAEAARAPLERRMGLRPGRGPKDRRGILMAWADMLEASGQGMRPGFPFEPGVHLPSTAFDCLCEAGYEAMDEGTAARVARLSRSRRGLEMMRMAALSTLTLHHDDDWESAQELGLVNLRAFRRDQGLQELELALDKARQTGQEDAFMRRLSRLDGPGLATAALGAHPTDQRDP